MHGVARLRLMNAATNLWAFSAEPSRSNAANAWTSSGAKALSDTLTQIDINAGGDTFDAGSIGITW